MPRLVGVVEYYFVQPSVDGNGFATWTHPDGYKFEIIRDSDMEEAIAERAERWLIRCRDQVKFCKEFGHGKEPCRRYGDEWLCERWLRLASGNTRTKERTMLVRVQVPL